MADAANRPPKPLRKALTGRRTDASMRRLAEITEYCVAAVDSMALDLLAVDQLVTDWIDCDPHGDIASGEPQVVEATTAERAVLGEVLDRRIAELRTAIDQVLRIL